jgi:Rieske Fe-S protein
MKFLRGLAKAIERMGGRIYGESPVLDFVGGSDAYVATRSEHRVRAGAIVVSTNTPVNDRVVIHTKQAAYQTYVVGLRVDAGDVVNALWWDTLDPYHYIRFGRTADEDRANILIVGGEDHKTGQDWHPEDRFGALEKWARERFPFAGDVAFHWSGQIMEPQDGLAFIGRNPMDHGNVYVVTGDSGNGMTHGAIAGMLITHLIMGRENPWATLYEPSRKSLRCAYTFLKENLNTAAQYADWVTPGEVAGAEDVANGNGAIMRQGLKKIALYRDDAGKLHQFSATCPHLKGVVAWNSAEQTWDCPCHGSRFSATTGDVLHGPALSGLAPVADE